MSEYAYERDCSARHDRSNRASTEVAVVAADNRRRLDGLVGQDDKGGLVADVAKLSSAVEKCTQEKRREFNSGALGTGAGAAITLAIIETLHQLGIL